MRGAHKGQGQTPKAVSVTGKLRKGLRTSCGNLWGKKKVIKLANGQGVGGGRERPGG